jgi:hypothetical protein
MGRGYISETYLLIVVLLSCALVGLFHIRLSLLLYSVLGKCACAKTLTLDALHYGSLPLIFFNYCYSILITTYQFYAHRLSV